MSELITRPIGSHDRHDVLTWRNDAVTRQMSLQNEYIGIEQHNKWFSSMLSSDDIKGYIGEYERQKIGVVFFEVKDEDCLVSINLNPQFRGRKLSTVLLRNSLKKSKSITHRTNFFIAKIKESNLASIKTFEHNGFTFVYRDNNTATYKLDTKKWFEEKNV